jgi:hypothetical protein
MFGPVTQLIFLQSVEPSGTPDVPTPFDSEVLSARKREWVLEVHPYRAVQAKLLELRSYQVRAGEGRRFLDLMLKALPIRERYSLNHGIWEAASGRCERVFHMWGYSSLAEREEVRAQLKQDAEWNKYVATILPMLGSLSSNILQPLPRTQAL